MVSRIDYCNSILAGLPACEFNRIQSVLNSAARLIYGRSKYDHVRPLLRDKLHWLRAEQRVRYKCCLLVYKALNGLAPSYIEQFCNKVAVSETRACLRSSMHNNLVIPRSLTKFGERSFSVSGPSAWNALTDYVKLSPSIDCFKANLKTFLFKQSYDSNSM